MAAKKTAVTVAAGVVALGAGLGVAGLASADPTATPSASPSSSASAASPGRVSTPTRAISRWLTGVVRTLGTLASHLETGNVK